MKRFFPFLFLILIPVLSVPVDYCNSTNSTYLMTENIDNSQYVNFPLAIEVMAYDGVDALRTAQPCTIVTYDISGNTMDIVHSIDPSDNYVEIDTGIFSFFQDRKLIEESLHGRLITNDQGFMRYALTLGDRYQVDNSYVVRVDCGSSCTKQTFDVERGTSGYWVYNWALGIIENINMWTWFIVFFLLVTLIIASVFAW